MASRVLAMFLVLRLVPVALGAPEATTTRPPPTRLADAAWCAGSHAGMAKCTRRAAGLGRHIDDACEAVRAMGASRAGQGMRWKPWSPDQQPVPFDKEARARFGKEIRELGRPPEISPAGALRELLKSTDVYNLDRESTRRPYCADKVRVVRDGVVPRPLVALLSEEAGAALRDPWRFIVKSDAEMSLLRDEDYIEPYTDPFLKVKKNMLGLVRKLKDIGFVTFRRKRRARGGLHGVSQGRHVAVGL